MLHCPSCTKYSSSQTLAIISRSCDTRMTAPSNSCKAMLNACRISKSRWLVGSSNTKTLGRCHTMSASVSLARSPPENNLLWVSMRSPRKSKLPKNARKSASEVLPARRCSINMGDASPSRLSIWCWLKYPSTKLSAALRVPAKIGNSPTKPLMTVDLPAPFIPSRPMRLSGVICRRIFSMSATPL